MTSRDFTDRPDRKSGSISSKSFMSNLKPKLVGVVTIVTSTILLTSLAFYNGYPFVDGDTGAYIEDALNLMYTKVNWARPVFYSIFILPLHLKVSLWPIIFAQGLIVSHLLLITMRITNQKVQPGVFLVVIIILTFFTTLPWLVGLILADLFTGVVILGIFLLGFGLDRLTRLETVYFFLLTAGAISFHLSHVPLALGLVIVTIVLQGLFRLRDWCRVKNVALLIGPIVLAVSAFLSFNIASIGEVTLSAGSPIFILGRLIEDGPARVYLAENCSEKKYALCPYRDELSTFQHFLWHTNSPLWKLGGPWKVRNEAREIVWGTLRAYPMQQLHISLHHFFKQFVSISTGVHLIPWLEDGPSPHTARIHRIVFGPSIHARYLASKQNMKTLPLITVRQIHKIAIVLSVPLAILLFIIFLKRKESLYTSLFGLILFGLIGNAFITGALSVVYDRFQSRIIWLVVFYVILGSLRLLGDFSLSRRLVQEGRNGGLKII